MRMKFMLPVAAMLMGAFVVSGFQSSEQISREKLKEMLTGLGLEVKDLDKTAGKEKYSFTISKGGLDIPIGAEISPNGNYIWFTALLKQAVPAGDKAIELLRSNATIQPSQFYLTKSDRVMIGLAIENRNVTSVQLRQRSDKLADDVAKTQDAWK